MLSRLRVVLLRALEKGLVADLKGADLKRAMERAHRMFDEAQVRLALGLARRRRRRARQYGAGSAHGRDQSQVALQRVLYLRGGFGPEARVRRRAGLPRLSAWPRRAFVACAPCERVPESSPAFERAEGGSTLVKCV